MKISGAHKAMKRVLIFLVTLGIIVPILLQPGRWGFFTRAYSRNRGWYYK